MVESIESDEISTPWHLWVIGIVALLWSGMGPMEWK